MKCYINSSVTRFNNITYLYTRNQLFLHRMLFC